MNIYDSAWISKIYGNHNCMSISEHNYDHLVACLRDFSFNSTKHRMDFFQLPKFPLHTVYAATKRYCIDLYGNKFEGVQSSMQYKKVFNTVFLVMFAHRKSYKCPHKNLMNVYIGCVNYVDSVYYSSRYEKHFCGFARICITEQNIQVLV